MERSTTAILHWSWWRRWHQAWARYHHYRRRQAQRPSPPAPWAATQQPVLSDALWSRLASALPSARRIGRPFAHDRRVVLQAILYVMETGCAWHTLPAHFPPWQTVYAQFVRWRKAGIWDTIWTELDQFNPRS